MASLEEFLLQYKSNKLSHSHIKNATHSIEQFTEFIGHTNYEEVTLNDINRFIIYIREEHEYSEGTLNIRKNYIKAFFKFFDLDHIVKKLQIKPVPNHLNPNDILVPEDIDFILDHEPHPMYKALITVLWESGGRIGELLAVKKDEDLIETSHGYRMNIFGSKTRQYDNAYREVLLRESATYVRDWLFLHNKPSENLFPVWASAVRDRFHTMGEHLRTEHNFKKPVNPHAYRHACATWLVVKKTDVLEIRKQMGWSLSSPMLERYVHLSTSYVFQSQMANLLGENGKDVISIKQPEETMFDRLKSVENIVETLMKRELEREPLLEAQMMLHPEDFTADEVRPGVIPTINKSVAEIEEMPRNPDTSIIKKDADREYFKEHFYGKSKGEQQA